MFSIGTMFNLDVNSTQPTKNHEYSIDHVDANHLQLLQFLCTDYSFGLWRYRIITPRYATTYALAGTAQAL